MQQQYSTNMGERSSSEYDWRTGQRQQIADAYWNKINGLNADGSSSGGGGGGAPAWVDPSTGMRSDIYSRYKALADTGGWTPDQMRDYRSWTTAPISGFYTGMKNSMIRANNAMGGYAGYNSQNAKLTRDSARQGYLAALQSEDDLQNQIRSAKERGLAGMASEAEAISSASRPMGGGGGGGGSDDDKSDYYLRQLTGLMGGAEDLPYAQLQGQGLNAQLGDPQNSGFNKAVKVGSVAAPIAVALI